MTRSGPLPNELNSQTTSGTANFAHALAALQRSDVIVFPTETLYGLGADAFNSDAVEQVFQLKGRDRHNPIPVLVADLEMLQLLVDRVSPLAQTLMERFWPGPLTIVLPARKGIPRPLLNPQGGVGVRISSHPIATKLVKALGRPLTATSANPSGKEAAQTVQQARQYFDGRVEIFLDGGTLNSTAGSTVIEGSARLKIIRNGEISAAELQAFLKQEGYREETEG